MKYLLSFFFVCCLCLTGCGVSGTLPKNTICLQVELGECGEVVQTIEIPVFFDDKNDKYIKELISNIEKRIYNNYYITYYVACLKSGEDVKNMNFTKPYYDESIRKVVFAFQFLDQHTLSLINQNTGELSLSFLETLKTEKEFPFFDKNKNGVMVCDYYLEVVNEVYKKYFGKDIDKGIVLLEYRYITPYKNIHSNADFKNGQTHSWVAAVRDCEGTKKIQLWIVQVNRGVWYLVTIFLMGVVYLTLYLCFNKKSLFKRKNRSKREKVG